MDNYPYIIAGLPGLVLDYESRPFNYKALLQSIKEKCSAKDNRLIEWFEAGSREDFKSHYFYSQVEKTGSKFLKEYFAFDRYVRNAKVAYLEGRDASEDSDDSRRLQAIFATQNLIEREKQLDRFFWDKIDSFVMFELFNMNVILAFIAKAAIVDRWSRLDQKAGEEFFRTLVGEVRGTFKGVRFDSNE